MVNRCPFSTYEYIVRPPSNFEILTSHFYFLQTLYIVYIFSPSFLSIFPPKKNSHHEFSYPPSRTRGIKKFQSRGSPSSSTSIQHCLQVNCFNYLNYIENCCASKLIDYLLSIWNQILKPTWCLIRIHTMWGHIDSKLQ